MKNFIVGVLLCLTLFTANIYADNAVTATQSDTNTIIGIQKYKESYIGGQKGEFSFEYSEFTSPSLGITFRYISSGEDALFGFTGRKEAYRLNNIICLGKISANNIQPNEKLGCIEFFDKKPKAKSYIQKNNTWSVIDLKKESISGNYSDIIVTKVHKVLSKKLWYLTYHKDEILTDYSWIKNIKSIKDIVSNNTTLSSTNSQSFTIPACNQYARLMRCVADKSGGGTEALISVDQAIAARHTLTSDQLYQTCTMAVDTARQNKEAYYQLGCYL